MCEWFKIYPYTSILQCEKIYFWISNEWEGNEVCTFVQLYRKYAVEHMLWFVIMNSICKKRELPMDSIILFIIKIIYYKYFWIQISGGSGCENLPLIWACVIHTLQHIMLLFIIMKSNCKKENLLKKHENVDKVCVVIRHSFPQWCAGH